MSTAIPQDPCLGCGDGVTVCKSPSTPFLTPKKNSPAFVRTPNPKIVRNKSVSNILQLATNPNITRRRAITLTEFTNQRNNKLERNSFDLSENEMLQVKKERAGIRIFQVLLLNAWRKRKALIQNLEKSKEVLQSENVKMEDQIKALHRFRILESEKREEAAMHVQNLEQELKENKNREEKLNNEKSALKAECAEYKKIISDLELETKNAENDLIYTHFVLMTKRCKLGAEQDKVKELLKETYAVKCEDSLLEEQTAQLNKDVEELQKQLFEAELKLQDTIFNNNHFENANKDLVQKLKEEITKRKALEKEREDLKSSIAVVEQELKMELQGGWRKNVTGLLRSWLKLLKVIAIMMLPALPNSISENA